MLVCNYMHAQIICCMWYIRPARLVCTNAGAYQPWKQHRDINNSEKSCSMKWRCYSPPVNGRIFWNKKSLTFSMNQVWALSSPQEWKVNWNINVDFYDALHYCYGACWHSCMIDSSHHLLCILGIMHDSRVMHIFVYIQREETIILHDRYLCIQWFQLAWMWKNTMVCQARFEAGGYPSI
jgi:hypothetical protein